MRRALLLAAFVLGCSGKEEDPQAPVSDATAPKKGDGRVRAILVDHILVSFQGAKNDTFKSARSRKEAEREARRILNVLKDGRVTFNRMKREYSDTQERPYFVVNKGFKPRARTDGFAEVMYEAYYPIPRRVAFALKPGEIGLAEYHEKHCPDGWRIVKRLR